MTDFRTVEDFLRLANPETEKHRMLTAPFKGDRPDVTATDAVGYGLVAGAGLAGYGAGIRGAAFYVFLGCVTFYAAIVTLADAFRRGKRNDALAAEAFSGFEAEGE